ncbi:protein of unknown function [Methylotuvimicrobium alcaliphilum 20Z]|uniref:Uncharacterized protein n=1 Tax=Methylotuvimicrobium alcaliphilum (strain DSM 19304 / NCIMB 14124 / VKM B-2133 / 20Z) TaxID=1091494 RepID=G4SYE0_META2|nr:protein of unknown function [Methylotuvimicrobium alcaliphilum 20Z]
MFLLKNIRIGIEHRTEKMPANPNGANLSNVHEGPATARQMKVQTVVGTVTRPTGPSP